MKYKSMNKILCNDNNIKEIVQSEIKRLGLKADLNHLDTSQVTSMHGLFAFSEFNGDISKWDVGNVKNMAIMFKDSEFNGDIAKWNTSKVESMCGMFYMSQFTGDISKWDVGHVTIMSAMFVLSEFNGDISKWNTSKVTDMNSMFCSSKFNGDISKWDVSNIYDVSDLPIKYIKYVTMNKTIFDSQFDEEIFNPLSYKLYPPVWDENGHCLRDNLDMVKTSYANIAKSLIEGSEKSGDWAAYAAKLWSYLALYIFIMEGDCNICRVFDALTPDPNNPDHMIEEEAEGKTKKRVCSPQELFGVYADLLKQRLEDTDNYEPIEPIFTEIIGELQLYARLSLNAFSSIIVPPLFHYNLNKKLLPNRTMDKIKRLNFRYFKQFSWNPIYPIY